MLQVTAPAEIGAGWEPQDAMEGPAHPADERPDDHPPAGATGHPAAAVPAPLDEAAGWPGPGTGAPELDPAGQLPFLLYGPGWQVDWGKALRDAGPTA